MHKRSKKAECINQMSRMCLHIDDEVGYRRKLLFEVDIDGRNPHYNRGGCSQLLEAPFWASRRCKKPSLHYNRESEVCESEENILDENENF
jgi:hypothetical protein